MTSISSTLTFKPYLKDGQSTDESFNDKVLHHLQKNKPEGDLRDIMDQMRGLSLDKNVSMHQLNEALLYANTHMRQTEEYKDYSESVLNKRSTQMFGVNVLFNKMMYKDFTDSESDTSW